MNRYELVGGPVDGMVLLIEKGKEPEQIEFRITEGCQLFPFYVLTEEGYYWHLATYPEPQEEAKQFIDLVPVNTVVGKGKLKMKLGIWAAVEELTGGG